MLAKDEELVKVKEKHLYAEQQLRDMEEKQQQVNLKKPQSPLSSCSVLRQETGMNCRVVKCRINTIPFHITFIDG